MVLWVIPISKFWFFFPIYIKAHLQKRINTRYMLEVEWRYYCNSDYPHFTPSLADDRVKIVALFFYQ